MEIKKSILNTNDHIFNTQLNASVRVGSSNWFVFTAYARHKKEKFDAHYDGIFKGIQKLIDYLEHQQLLRKNLDKSIETERLYSLVDGIALHAMLDPKRLNRDRICELFVYHLHSICVEE